MRGPVRLALVAALLVAVPTAALAQEAGDAEAKAAAKEAADAEKAAAKEAADAEKAAAKEAADAEKAAKDVAAAEAKQSSGPFAAGKVVVRGTAGADLDQVINLGGTNLTPGASAYVEAGIGYFVIDNLEVDVDASAHMTFGSGFGLGLTVTPGLRYQVVPQFTLRAGVPIEILPNFGLGVLGGVAYCQSLGSAASLVIGADYTFWLTEGQRSVAPFGTIEPHVGIQTHF